MSRCVFRTGFIVDFEECEMFIIIFSLARFHNVSPSMTVTRDPSSMTKHFRDKSVGIAAFVVIGKRYRLVSVFDRGCIRIKIYVVLSDFDIVFRRESAEFCLFAFILAARVCSSLYCR
jgi:hypothetical protein